MAYLPKSKHQIKETGGDQFVYKGTKIFSLPIANSSKDREIFNPSNPRFRTNRYFPFAAK